MEVGVKVEEWNGGWSESGRVEWRLEWDERVKWMLD